MIDQTTSTAAGASIGLFMIFAPLLVFEKGRLQQF
jgi:hypothetical protein